MMSHVMWEPLDTSDVTPLLPIEGSNAISAEAVQFCDCLR